MLEGLGAGWTASFLAKVYTGLSPYLIKEFLQAETELSVVVILALFVTFGAEREFTERTSATAQRGSAKPATGRTPVTNRDHPWELGSVDEIDPLS